MQSKVQDLDAAITAFLAAPADANLQQAKAALKNAYLQFEKVSVNQYGPAETYLLGNFINTFPADTTKIKLTYSPVPMILPAQVHCPARTVGTHYLLAESGALQKSSAMAALLPGRNTCRM